MKRFSLKRSLSLSLISFIFLVSCTNNSPLSTATSNEKDTKPQAITVPGDTSSNNTDSTTKDSSGSAPAPYINPGSGSSSGTPMAGATGSPGSAVLVPGTSSSADISDTGSKAAPQNSPEATTTGSSNGTILPQPDYKTLSAGDIDDNEKFTDYLSYLSKYGTALRDKIDVLKVDISNRIIISVMDKDKKGIPDSLVQVETNGKIVFNGKTYSNGKTLFFPSGLINYYPDCTQQQDCNPYQPTYKVTVQKGSLYTSSEFNPGSNKEWNIELTDKRESITNPNLDLVFLIDTTGSMGDEINSIQKTIGVITDKINGMDIKSKIRYSLVAYKDRVDPYRVKRYDFTSNLNYFQQELNDLSASGGGDYRESLNEGLYHAVNKVSWTDQDDAVRLIFLIADAPPHLDYSDDIQYTDSMVQAVKKGIKIYPVAASGLDNSGEYIFRQLGQFTFAKFLFLTYGGDEQTPGTTPHHVGEFQETNLDTLVVNIVNEELNNLK